MLFGVRFVLKHIYSCQTQNCDESIRKRKKNMHVRNVEMVCRVGLALLETDFDEAGTAVKYLACPWNFWSDSELLCRLSWYVFRDLSQSLQTIPEYSPILKVK
jgi:hypothetical protein